MQRLTCQSQGILFVPTAVEAVDGWTSMYNKSHQPFATKAQSQVFVAYQLHSPFGEAIHGCISCGSTLAGKSSSKCRWHFLTVTFPLLLFMLLLFAIVTYSYRRHLYSWHTIVMYSVFECSRLTLIICTK